MKVGVHLNPAGELRVSLTDPVGRVTVLSRTSTELLAADLIRALSTSDRAVAADSEMHVEDRSSRLTSQGHYDPWI